MNRKEKQARQAIDRLINSREWEPPSDDTMLSTEERRIIDMLPAKPSHSIGSYTRVACLVLVGLLLCGILSYSFIPPVRAWVASIYSYVVGPFDGSASSIIIPGYEITSISDHTTAFKRDAIEVIASIKNETVDVRLWLDSAVESFTVDGMKITDDIVTIYEKDGCYMAVAFVDREQVWISMYNGGSDDFIAVLHSIKIER